MQIDFITVLIAVVALMALAVPGFILTKLKMLPENTGSALSTIVLYGCQPVLVFMSFQEYYKAEIALNMLYVAILSLVIHVVMFGIIALVIRNKSKSAKITTAKYACLFSNCGYMGLPFLDVVFNGSKEIIIYAAIVIAIFNILNWTLGIYMLTGDKKEISLKKTLLNPTILGIVLGAIYFFAVGTPIVDLIASNTVADSFVEKLMASVDVIGDLVTPLALTVIGIRLANVKLKALFVDKWAYIVAFMKLVVMSILTILVVAFLPFNPIVKYVMFFLLSMPSATSTTMFAIKFKGDGDSASVFVLLTTILSILTIPLMYLLMNEIVLM